MKIVLSADQRQMLEWLAKTQRRSMNDVVRLALERVYHAELLRHEGTGRSRGDSRADGQSS